MSLYDPSFWIPQIVTIAGLILTYIKMQRDLKQQKDAQGAAPRMRPTQSTASPVAYV